MPIAFACRCGATLRVPDEHAGRRVKCPSCAATTTAPGPAFEVVDEDDGPKYVMKRAVDVPEEEEDSGGKKKKEPEPQRSFTSPEPAAEVDTSEKPEKKRKKKPKPDTPRGEVRKIAQHADSFARAMAEKARRREAFFRTAYLIAGPIFTVAGICVVVFAGRGTPDATMWTIVGGVIALCGLIAFLALTGILPHE